MTPPTCVAAPAGPRVVSAAALSALAAGAPSAEHERVARGLRGARARTGLSAGEVVAMLTRQGIALSVRGLCRAEVTGVIALTLAACLADVYGTTTDGLAGRRLHRQRLSLDECPSAPRASKTQF
jgi:hypothetical protein